MTTWLAPWLLLITACFGMLPPPTGTAQVASDGCGPDGCCCAVDVDAGCETACNDGDPTQVSLESLCGCGSEPGHDALPVAMRHPFLLIDGASSVQPEAPGLRATKPTGARPEGRSPAPEPPVPRTLA